MFKKSVFVLTVITCSILFSAFALGESNGKPTITFTNDKNQTDKLPYKELSKEAKARLRDKANKYNIDIVGLTDEQIFEKTTAAENKEVINKADQYGINTTGLTAEQVKAKIVEDDKKANKKINVKRLAEEKKVIDEMVIIYEIDTTGLTDEQIKEKVHEILMPDLIKKAKELNIPYDDGLTYDQLLMSIKNTEIENSIK